MSKATAPPPQDAALGTALPDADTAPTPSHAPDAPAPAGAESSAVVGNRHTLVFHARDSQALPAEENRHYFTSEAEALAAGYHRSKHDRDRERAAQ
ncbi:MAG: hypothetical protein H0X24_03970 [Ktedonobacterales bacterium]|nr:hypothetical protein [Ktedonobacterales bacterium]